MARITNKDIARLAGVSPAAVSIAVNGRPGISQETRERILKIARQNHYCPGIASLQILQDRSRFIAALFRTDAQLEDQIFYSEMGSHAMVACCERGCTLVSTYITDSSGTITLPQAILNRSVDGILVFGDQEPGIYTELSHTGIPFVVLDSSRPGSGYPSVLVDYHNAAYQATRHLIELGHRDIAYLSNGVLHDFNMQTLAGFQQAASEAGIALYPNRFQIDVEDEASLRRCIDRAMVGPVLPTAFFCTVDVYAINAMRYLHTRGFRVPQDISVVGIDDVAMSRYVIPSLTTLRVDRKHMIQLGLDMLEQLAAGTACGNQTLPAPLLICRESAAAPRSRQ